MEKFYKRKLIISEYIKEIFDNWEIIEIIF